MNIKELQSYFGEWNGLPDNRARALLFDDCGAYGNFGDLRLYSVFQPIVSRLDGHTAAHEALLRARNSRNVAVTPAAAFELPESSAAVVYLDRLCRMVHAVNFFHLGEQRGDLFLNVDFRHVLSVESGDHGRTMETLLGHCGLTPTQVVLEVIESHIDRKRPAPPPVKRLRSGATSWFSRGGRDGQGRGTGSVLATACGRVAGEWRHSEGVL